MYGEQFSGMYDKSNIESFEYYKEPAPSYNCDLADIVEQLLYATVVTDFCFNC